jgi:putative transposase
LLSKAPIAQSIKDIYNALSKDEALDRQRKIVDEYKVKAPAFCKWLEENIEEGLSYYQFPRSHWKKIRTVNGLERVNQEIKRRTKVAHLFPNEAACLRLVTAILAEQNDEWVSGRRYIDFNEE